MPIATVYSQLNSITKKYFDTDSDTFVDEIIKNRLNIKPEKLTLSQLKQILQWIEISAYFINKDKKTVDAYIIKLKKLAGQK